MRDADRNKELLRMFKAGHVWACKKCGGAIEESKLCSDCGAVSKDAVAASGLAASEVISKQFAAERRRTKAMALGKAESTPVTPLSISERVESVEKAVAEVRRSALVAAKAMALGKAEPTPVTPSDTRLPKRVKASMVIEPEAEKPTLAPPSVAPCPTCGAPLRIFQRCESCHQKSQAMEQKAEQKRQEAETLKIAIGCPSCQHDGWKLASLVFSEGFSTVNANTEVIGIGTFGVGLGVGKISGLQQSELSRMTAPPPRPSFNMDSMGSGSLGLMFACGLFAPFLLWAGLTPPFDLKALLFGAGLLLVIWFGITRIRKATENDNVHSQAIERWKKLKMCTRCGHQYT